MSDEAKLIWKWQQCEKLAVELGARLCARPGGGFEIAGKGQKFKGYHTCDTVAEVWGYLKGVQHEDR